MIFITIFIFVINVATDILKDMLRLFLLLLLNSLLLLLGCKGIVPSADIALTGYNVTVGATRTGTTCRGSVLRRIDA